MNKIWKINKLAYVQPMSLTLYSGPLNIQKEVRKSNRKKKTQK